MTIEPGPAVAELRLVARIGELVVVRPQGVEQQGQAVAARGGLVLRHVDRVGLQPASKLADALGGVAAGDRVVGPLLRLEVAGEDPVHGPASRHAPGLAAAEVSPAAGQLAEVDPGVKRQEVARGERCRLGLVAPPGRVGDRLGPATAGKVRPGLVVAEGDVEEGGWVRQALGAAWSCCVGRGPGDQVRIRRRVPEPDPGGQADLLPTGIPGAMRDEDLDLAPALGDRDARRGAHPLPIGGALERRGLPVDGEEELCRGAGVGAERERRGLFRVADGDRRRDERGGLEGVQRDPERGRAAKRLDAELEQVGGVVGVPGPGGIRVGPVRRREAVPAGPRVAGIARGAPGAVIVVDEVLVEELAAPVGAGARDEDRLRVPDAAIRELGRRRGLAVEHRRPRPRRRTAVQGGRGLRNGRQRRRREDDRDRHAHPDHARSLAAERRRRDRLRHT